ncbi:unnamed protein product [Plutella xylostella]|uniref:(diamondback moth) hypothetical protein n=1 Tax=Plutella xylostella TaxID=51655 RepID=A0A8S4DKC6_PLUXY|nr:unnamed protein product [Plutella xylostella]
MAAPNMEHLANFTDDIGSSVQPSEFSK